MPTTVMTGILCVGIGTLILVLWLWFSYRSARAEQFDLEQFIRDEEKRNRNE
jgi:hypothetical protein